MVSTTHCRQWVCRQRGGTVLGEWGLTTEPHDVSMVPQASPSMKECGSFPILPVIGVCEEDVIEEESRVDVRQMQPVLTLLPVKPPQIYSHTAGRERGVSVKRGDIEWRVRGGVGVWWDLCLLPPGVVV